MSRPVRYAMIVLYAMSRGSMPRRSPPPRTAAPCRRTCRPRARRRSTARCGRPGAPGTPPSAASKSSRGIVGCGYPSSATTRDDALGRPAGPARTRADRRGARRRARRPPPPSSARIPGTRRATGGAPGRTASSRSAPRRTPRDRGSRGSTRSARCPGTCTASRTPSGRGRADPGCGTDGSARRRRRRRSDRLCHRARSFWDAGPDQYRHRRRRISSSSSSPAYCSHSPRRVARNVSNRNSPIASRSTSDAASSLDRLRQRGGKLPHAPLLADLVGEQGRVLLRRRRQPLAVLEAVQPGGQHRADRQVGVRRAVHRLDLHVRRARGRRRRARR